MSKILLIDRCEDCMYVDTGYCYVYKIGPVYRCCHSEGNPDEPIPINGPIPEWCPLLDAERDIKPEKRIPKCPRCGSEGIRRVMYDDYGVKHAMMECENCGEAGEYDWFDSLKRKGE